MEVVELDGPHRLTAHGVVEAAIAAIGDHAFFEQVRCTHRTAIPRGSSIYSCEFAGGQNVEP